jgi:hypothetical protein
MEAHVIGALAARRLWLRWYGRQRERRARQYWVSRREDLIELLGGRCAMCGQDWGLEVDHEDGKDWCAREENSRTRIRRYWQEYQRGVKLRALCKGCNSGYLNYGR